MKKLKSLVSVSLALMLACGLFVGCGSGSGTGSGAGADSGKSGGSGKTSAFQMAFCSLGMNSDAIAAFGTDLQSKVTGLTVDGKAPQFTSVVMGAVTNNTQSGVLSDPMLGAGGIMKFTAMIASKEIDIAVMDMENAARSARSDTFKAIDEVLSQEEMDSLKDKLLSFDKVDDAGNPTGEKTAVCGIDVSENEGLQAIFGKQQLGVFIIGNAPNAELAKEVMLSVAGK